MENTIRRRLDSITRHLLLQETHNQVSCQDVLSEDEREYVNSAPVVIGAMVLDIHAKPFSPTHPRTTTPGKVQYVKGGVARNVAECMSKLGIKPFLISVAGIDMPGNLLLENWKSFGLSMKGIRRDQNISTPVVSNIFDNTGELASAVASVEAVETFLTPDWICSFRSNFQSSPLIMVDANLHVQSLEAVCQLASEINVPVWFEPVSISKSRRISSIVKCITYTSPNEDELLSMANALSNGQQFYKSKMLIKSNCPESILAFFHELKPAICILLDKGIKFILVTLGENGVFLCCKGTDFIKTVKREDTNLSEGKLRNLINLTCPENDFSWAWESEGYSDIYTFHFPALPASVVNLTGAGDCLVGGILASLCLGLNIIQSTAVGVAVAKTAVETEENVPFAFKLKSVADDSRRVYSSVKQIGLFSQTQTYRN